MRTEYLEGLFPSKAADLKIITMKIEDERFCCRAVVAKGDCVSKPLFKSAEHEYVEDALEDLIFLFYQYNSEEKGLPSILRDALNDNNRFWWLLSLEIDEVKLGLKPASSELIGAIVEAGLAGPKVPDKYLKRNPTNSRTATKPEQASALSKTQKRNAARRKAKAKAVEPSSGGSEANGQTQNDATDGSPKEKAGNMACRDQAHNGVDKDNADDAAFGDKPANGSHEDKSKNGGHDEAGNGKWDAGDRHEAKHSVHTTITELTRLYSQVHL